MIDAQHVIAERCCDASDAPCVTSSFQAEDVVAGAHAARSAARTSRCCSSRRSITSRRRYAYRDEIAREVEPEPRQPARARAVARPVADEHRRLLRAPQSRTALRRARSVRHLVHRAAARPVAVARQPAARRAVHAAERQGAAEGQPAGASGRRKDVWDYAKAHDIPLLPLYELGYSSIGCEPCTSLPLDPSNPRSGRWQGQKLECGIHIKSA